MRKRTGKQIRALVDIGAEVGRWYFVEMGDSDD